jgi:hypothetical protein
MSCVTIKKVSYLRTIDFSYFLEKKYMYICLIYADTNKNSYQLQIF